MVKEVKSRAIANWDSLNPIQASVVDFVDDPTIKWLVLLNPDGSKISWGKPIETTQDNLYTNLIPNNLLIPWRQYLVSVGLDYYYAQATSTNTIIKIQSTIYTGSWWIIDLWLRTTLDSIFDLWLRI